MEPPAAPIIQWPYGRASSQKWTLGSIGNVNFILLVGRRQVMDVRGGSTASNAKLVIQKGSGSVSQLWKIVTAGDETFRFINGNSNLSANAASGSTADGDNLIQ